MTTLDPFQPSMLPESSLSTNEPKQRRANGGALLNHLVRAQQDRLWDRDSKCLGGLEVDHQLDLGWLQDRQISRLGAVENLSGVNARLAIGVDKARCVAHEAA